MAESQEGTGTPFADLVREALKPKGMTYRKLAERSVDPQAGHKISPSTIWKVADGQPIRIEKKVVRAFAAGLGLPLRTVQLAVAEEYVGMVADDPFQASTPEATVVVAHVPGLTAGDMPKVGELLSRFASGNDSAPNSRG
ncbi:hypothetical protein [Streptomyces sp. MZ04]|uniref:hypothetical protein n=1 Tax=Streptomyces sp. MZ04 TaxID=2559236 RepID=UPI00107ED609|nr:hypothetical protein [Streptomyces sp. MZ04]TGB14398.1 hypothetical protein E2651_06120 [Streptomyces sp. MZ04]